MSDAASRDSRAQLAAQVDRNVEAGRRTMAAVEAQTKYFDDETKAEFAAIARGVRAAEARLRRTLKYLETASAAEWPRARAALEVSYEAYAQAVSAAERLATEGSSTTNRAPYRR